MPTARALFAAAAIALLAAPTAAHAEIKTEEVEYTHDGTTLQGYFAWDDAKPGKRPGVLVVHEWWGHNEHARNAAKRLAQAGYVGFALDMFGKGKVTTHPQEAQGFVAESMKDPAEMLTRFRVARARLVQHPNVDAERIGAIGYCFGGAVVLAAVRAGEDLDAVATLHGALATETPAEKGRVKPRILVMTGAADPMVPADQVAALEKEMKAAGASYRVIRYPGAKHGFTNPEADKAGLEGVVYNAAADKKSWNDLIAFLRTALK